MGAALAEHQIERLNRWIPGWTAVRDHSWGLVDTVVLEVRHGTRRLIVKASGDQNHHLGREIRAHREWLSDLVTIRRAPELLHADEDARVIVTRYLPGTLVQGSPSEWDPDTYRQSGALLYRLHAQAGFIDEEWAARETRRTLAWLEQQHRIPAATVERIREVIRAWGAEGPLPLVPTHGDWQPRNWLIDEGVVSAIDFGRAGMRPAMTDFVRLANQQFVERGDLEAAFLDGYGSDPRRDPEWPRMLLRESVGTAVWAHGVGDEAFERHGLRMLTRILPVFG